MRLSGCAALPRALGLRTPSVPGVRSGGFGWRVAPEIDVRVNTGEREVRLRADARGHRVGAVEPKPAAHRALALGDSFLAAIQVEHHDTLTARLEESLSAALGERVRVRVVNTGVAASGSAMIFFSSTLDFFSTGALGSLDAP